MKSISRVVGIHFDSLTAQRLSEEQNTLIESQISKASQHQEREADIFAAQEELQRRHVRLIEHWDQLTERVQSLVDRLDPKGRS